MKTYRENKELMSKVGSATTAEEAQDVMRQIWKLDQSDVAYAIVADAPLYLRKPFVNALRFEEKSLLPFDLSASYDMGHWTDYINELVSYQNGNPLQSLTRHLVVHVLDGPLSDVIFPLLNKVASDASYREDVLKGGGLMPFLLDLPASLFREGIAVLSVAEGVSELLSSSPSIVNRLSVCESVQVNERYFQELITCEEGSALKECIRNESEGYEVVKALLFRVRHNPFYSKQVLEGGGLVSFLIALDDSIFAEGLGMILGNDDVNLALEKDARIKEKIRKMVFAYKRP